ncbi:MAG: YceI family protein [Bacteroidota bacterium]|jgi:polyisoprenoid-binding protein YceI
MKNLFYAAIILFAFTTGSCSSDQSSNSKASATKDTTDTEPNRLLPKKLRGLPVGLIGGHDPNPTLAVFEDSMYVWKHNTSITSVAGDLKLIEYGSFVWTDEGWYLRITMTPQEFAQTYNCPNAELKAGVTYTDPASWRRQEVLTGGDAMWYYIAEDKNGKRYKGTALIETEALLAPAVGDTGAVTFDPNRCKASWTGYGEVGDYSLTGTLPIKTGWISFTNNLPKAGELILNMKGITHPDENLVSHLNGEDFFNTEKYPEARFKLTKAAALNADSVAISGELTLCGKTQPILFAARILRYGKITQLIAAVSIDRTRWGIKYNSNSFFGNLGDNAIKNEINLQFALTGLQQ